MAITSVVIGGIELETPGVSATGAETAYALEAQVPVDAIAVEMANRHPVYQRDQVKARTIPIVVYLTEPTFAARKATFDAFVAAWSGGLKTLQWTDGTTKTLTVHVHDLVAANWYSRCSAEAVAYDPVAV